jgi:hypothetical protein
MFLSAWAAATKCLELGTTFLTTELSVFPV